MSAPRRFTFEEWRATGVDVESIGEGGGLADMGLCGISGRTYDGPLYIERGASADWCLTIGNSSEESDDLEKLERQLFNWGSQGGLFDIV